MSYDEFIRKTDDAAQMSRDAVTPSAKENAYNAFFDAATDYFNESLTGDIVLADGRTVFIPAIEH